MSRFPSDDHGAFLHVSVHDVTPELLPKVQRIVEFLRSRGFMDVTLLVVPGCRWNKDRLNSLGELAREGYTLAGHGWRHRIDHINGLGHLLHSLFISRKVAEHLAEDSAGISRLITRCHAWFAEHDLEPPKLYVPPAWAMGSISRDRLAQLPFQHYEYLTGFYDARAGVFRRVPLVGFEADSWARFLSLYPLNQLNLLLSRATGNLRIALHPNDLDLLMGRALRTMFDSGTLSWLRMASSTP